MIPGELYINGKDAWVTWGAFLEEGSDSALLTPANTKPFVTNKNRSEHGKRFIANNPRIDERDVLLVFCILADSKSDFLEKYEAFVSELHTGVVKLKVKGLRRVYTLIEPNFQPLSFYDDSCKLSVRFNEPNPHDRDQLVEVLGTIGSKILLTLNGQAIKI